MRYTSKVQEDEEEEEDEEDEEFEGLDDENLDEDLGEGLVDAGGVPATVSR